MRTSIKRALAAALILSATAPATIAHADVKDYEFRLVVPAVKAETDSIVAVRLVNKVTGKPVPNAVIYATRLDMAPEGMEGMTAPLTPVGESEPGLYRFKADFSMAGKWQLSLAAKVQGETGTVQSKLVVQAGK